MENFIAKLVKSPASASALTIGEWDLLVRQARFSNLLGYLYNLLNENGLVDSIPEIFSKHFLTGYVWSERHREVIHHELSEISRALAPLDSPVVVLKGAAYACAGLSAGRGRIFTDIDILVPRARMEEAEERLNRAGWMNTKHDDYDDRYYRKWMHEIPPLKHRTRKSIIDLHHAILPETARIKTDTTALFSNISELEAQQGLYILGPEDLVLHSASHLIHEGEFDHGLRDLTDLDALFREFSRTQGFWSRLESRAQDLNLVSPLHYAVYFCHHMLGTPIPSPLISRSEETGVRARVVRGLLAEGLKPNHHLCRDRLSGLKLWLLYVRSHYLRMPLHLLVPHLLYKATITPWKELWAERQAKKALTVQDLLLRNRITR